MVLTAHTQAWAKDTVYTYEPTVNTLTTTTTPPPHTKQFYEMGIVILIAQMRKNGLRY